VVIWASIGSEDGDASAEQPARAEGDETIAAGGRVPEGEASARDEGAWGQAAETAEVVAPSAVESEGESEARTEAETGPDPEMPPEDPATRATGQPNPWAGPTPRLLADVKRALDRGQRVSSRTDGRLLAHARDNRSDPRPQILLGRMYLARGWRPDAMERFEVAYRTSPTAAGDPRMLDALVLLAAHRATANRAATLMRDAYGVPRSIEAIDAALATGRLDRESTDRLGRVRQALQ
jgi:hypothetical protein